LCLHCETTKGFISFFQVNVTCGLVYSNEAIFIPKYAKYEWMIIYSSKFMHIYPNAMVLYYFGILFGELEDFIHVELINILKDVQQFFSKCHWENKSLEITYLHAMSTCQ